MAAIVSVQSEIRHNISERKVTLSPPGDIGGALNSLNIQSFEIIKVSVKSGNYTWEEEVTLPEASRLCITGEGYVNGGRKNNVFVSMTRERTQPYKEKEYARNSRLIIGRDATAEIYGMNIKEAITGPSPKEKAPTSRYRGVFNLSGDNSRLYLQQGEFSITTSPFINICGLTYGRVIFGHSHFTRIGGESTLQIVSIERGGDFGGSRVVVSCSHTTIGAGCALGGNGVELIN